jgi:hypothetical protein
MTSQQHDWTYNINNQGHVTWDVGEWDRVTTQFVAPISGTLYPYGSLDGGAIRGQTNGNAQLALNFTAIQVKNLATGSSVTSVTAAGLYEADVNFKYLKWAGSAGVSVYKMIQNDMKIF